MKSFLGHVVGIAVVAILSLLLSLFAAYVSVDIAHLFTVPLLSSFTIANFFGAFYILSISRIGSKINEKSETESTDVVDMVVSSGVRMFGYAFILLVSWGMAHLAHLLFF